jgi:hypothetical protein
MPAFLKAGMQLGHPPEVAWDAAEALTC